MDKSKVKSILPKPSPSLPGTPTGPGISVPGRSGTPSSIKSSAAKRKSLNDDYSAKKFKRKSSSVTSPNGKNSAAAAAAAAEAAEEAENAAKQTGHRPVTSCTFCRQHKIKCDASENYPNPCQRCDRMGLKCEIDPQFRPKKGSQIQSLKSDVDELKAKIEMLTKNESLLTQALNQHNMNFLQSQQQQQQQQPQVPPNNAYPAQSQTGNTPNTLASLNFSSNGANTPVHWEQSPTSHTFNPGYNPSPSQNFNDSTSQTGAIGTTQLSQVLHENSDNTPSATATPYTKNEADYKPLANFVLGDVTLTLEKANELHDKFVNKLLPFMPIISTRSATELYYKSQLLFWAVISTAALSEPEPTLYMSLASLIKQLAIETCWIRTPRSTHVIQALIILSMWPLPNEKVLDDCSYRFIGLAKNLSLQLGLHRGGEFIQEFSRTQVSLGPDAEKWRTRSWLAVFFCEQFWSSVLGLPPSINTTDYLLENARIDQSLPKDFRCLISLSIFQCKMVNVMGISVTRPDGLLEPSNRAGSLNILDRELDRLRFKLKIDDGSAIEVYFLYIKLMICCFAFLPGTPIEDQVKYVSSAYLSATRIITIISQMLNNNLSLIELPIYVRQGMTYSALFLFKLHLSRYLIDKYVDSARQSIVTVHRLLRNTLSSWQDLKNDISRNAKVLENLNIVLYTYPNILINDINDEVNGSIISRMRSHLTASLFYDLVWCVHEARRRTLIDKNNNTSGNPQLEDTEIPNNANAHHTKVNNSNGSSGNRKPAPLPFYNQITKDDFKTITTTTPNGTTITTLVPTDQAMHQARVNAGSLNKPLEINGIPLAMLDATGSINDTLKRSGGGEESSVVVKQEPGAGNVGTLPSQQFPTRSQIQQSPPSLASQQLPQQNLLATPDLPTQHLQQSSFVDQQHNLEVLPGDSLYMDGPMQSVQSAPLGVEQPVPQYSPSGQPNGVAGQYDNFFQQQSNGWLNNDNYQDDDFLGWFDVNMISEK